MQEITESLIHTPKSTGRVKSIIVTGTLRPQGEAHILQQPAVLLLRTIILRVPAEDQQVLRPPTGMIMQLTAEPLKGNRGP